MRNATHKDSMWLHSGEVVRNAAFRVNHPWFGTMKAEVLGIVNAAIGRPQVLMETMEGAQFFAEMNWVQAVPRKQGTPAKPKKEHIKGSKPWMSQQECVPYDPALIKAGVKVKCRDGKIRTVVEVDDDLIHLESNLAVWKDNGAQWSAKSTKEGRDIIGILVDKPSPSTNAKYNGYTPNEWHFWQGESNIPPVSGDVIVRYWMRDGCIASDDYQEASRLNWRWVLEGWDIIAFKIVGDKQ